MNISDFPEAPTFRQWRALVTVLVGTFMAILDSTIVNVAIPSIKTGLNASPAAIEWVVAGYLLAFGLMLVPAGRLGDRIGYKPLFMSGVALFTLSSAACAFATSGRELVAARVVQGLAAGLFGPSVQATIQLLFRGRYRSRAFGILGTMVGLSSAVGPILGGVIIAVASSADGWRWVFFVNVIIGTATLAAGARLVPDLRPKVPHRLDPVGLGLITLGLLAVFFPLVEGQSVNWPVWTFVMLGSAIPIFALLAFWERNLSRKGGEPILGPELLGSAGFSGGTVIAMLYFASFSSMFVVLSLFWQSGLGRSALASGLMVTPFALGNLTTGSMSHRASARFGKRVLVIGCALLAVSVVATAAIVDFSHGSISAWAIAIPLAAGGMGNGIFIAPNQDFILKRIPHHQAGTAGGVLQTSQRVGSALGVAATATIFFAHAGNASAPAVRATDFSSATSLSLLANLAFLAAVALMVTFTRAETSTAITA